MKYRILLLLALLCAIPVAAAGGTLAMYSYETAFSFSIVPETGSSTLSEPQAEAAATPDTQVAKSGTQTQPDEISLQEPPAQTPAATDTAHSETLETEVTETPEPDNRPAEEPSPEAPETAKPTDTPDAAKITAANEI